VIVPWRPLPAHSSCRGQSPPPMWGPVPVPKLSGSSATAPSSQITKPFFSTMPPDDIIWKRVRPFLPSGRGDSGVGVRGNVPESKPGDRPLGNTHSGHLGIRARRRQGASEHAFRPTRVAQRAPNEEAAGPGSVKGSAVAKALSASGAATHSRRKGRVPTFITGEHVARTRNRSLHEHSDRLTPSPSTRRACATVYRDTGRG